MSSHPPDPELEDSTATTFVIEEEYAEAGRVWGGVPGSL
jgi:hypothetical protein